MNLCNSLGSGLSDLHHCVGCGRGPWLESVINFPFLPVALSWRPSLFPLGGLDIGHNKASSKDRKYSEDCQRLRGGQEELLFNGYKVSELRDEEVLEIYFTAM